MKLRWRIKPASIWFYWYLWFCKGYRGNQYDSRLEAITDYGGKFEIVGNFVDTEYAHNWHAYYVDPQGNSTLLIANASLDECVTNCEITHKCEF